MSGPTVLAWSPFQPRTRELARALGGQPEFITLNATGSRLRLPLRYLRDAAATWRALSRNDPPMVVVISPPIFAPLVAWLWCRRHRRPLVIDCHTNAFSGRWKWTRSLHRLLGRRAAAVSVHTDKHFEEVAEWGVPALLLPDDLPGAELAGEAAPADRPVVLVAGSLDSEEPVREAIAAASLVPEAEFRFTGETSRQPAEAIAAAPANAVFTGWIAYDRFLGEMRAAAVVAAFSTDPHVMNRAAFEAVGLEKPLVLTDYQGLRDRFGEAALYTPNRPEAMAAAIRDALRRRAELGAASAAAGRRLRAQRQAAMRRLAELVARPGAPAAAGRRAG